MDKSNFARSSGPAFVKSMENKPAKKFLCSNCSLPFSIRDPLHPRGLRCPLVLYCGHSACEHCVRTSLQNIKKVICNICKETSIPKYPNAEIRENFPINIQLLGIFTERNWGQDLEDSKIKFVPAGASLSGSRSSSSLIKWKEQKREPCSECERDAEWKCVKCQESYCGPCFSKVHKAGKTLRKHEKIPVASTAEPLVAFSLPLCEKHTEQKLEFYCNECKQMVCSHCIIHFHQGHTLITRKQKNEADVPKLTEALDFAVQVLKRALNTEKKLNANVPANMSDCNIAAVLQELASHFLYLYGVLQNLHKELEDQLKEVKTPKSYLETTTSKLSSNIHQFKQLIQECMLAKDPNYIDKVDIDELTNVLQEETKKLPCHLIINEKDTADSCLRFIVDEMFMNTLKSHCAVEGESNFHYCVASTNDLPPDYVLEPIEDETDYEAMISVSSRASSMSALSETFRPESSNSTHNDKAAKPVGLKLQRSSTELIKGSADLVTVSHVRDPASFYVHRAADIATLEQLSEQLTHHASTFNSPPDEVLINGLYIVQYNQDKKWYRARTRAIMPPSTPEGEDMVDILYIDYGNTQIVPVSLLRTIPPSFASTPALALHCSLFGIVPPSGKWTQDCVKTFVKMVNGYHVKMIVMDYVPDTYQVDLCQVHGETLDNDVPISVRDALVFLEHACFLESDKFKIPVMEKSTAYFQENDFRKGAVLEVLISHIDTPHNFYVQRLGDHARYLSTIMGDMNKEYANAGNKGWIYKPQIGMPCAAKFSLDKRWYRAKVIDLPGHSMVEVFYVDYGNQETLPWTQLRKLQPQFLRFAAQGIHCSLSDVMPKQQTWTPEVTKHMVKVTGGKVLRLYVDDMQRHQLKVILYDSQNEVDICINGLLVRDGFATSVGVSSSLVEYHKMNGMPFQQPPPVAKKPVKTKSTKKRAASLIQPLPDDDPAEDSGRTCPEQEDGDPFRLEVKVLSCPSPSCIYVTLTSQEEQLKNLMCELQEFYTNATSHIENWEVDNKCCAFSVRHKQWYRAIIVELLPEDQAKVFMKDFAEVETVPIVNLQLLEPRFFTVRDGAIKCHLSGVKAAGDRNEWTTLANEYLAEQIEKYQAIYITKKGEIENFSLPVELWVKEFTPGGPFEPTREDWLTLNKKLTDQGLAIPIRGETAESESVPSLQVLQELEAHSQEASKNSVSEWLQLSSQYLHFLQNEGSAKTESSDAPVDEQESSDMDIDEVVEDEGAAICATVSDWMPPLQIKKKEFKAIPTYVDDDGFIYLQDYEQSNDILAVMSNALLTRFKNSEPKPHDLYWFPNQLCIALYHYDNKWYRGKVVEVNESDRTVKVKFVDYGNIEVCKAAELRKNIFMTEVPIQCHKCDLYGVKPATEDGKWSFDTLEFIHGTIVDKPCLVKIRDDPRIGKPYQISLSLAGMDISDILVDMHFAVYSHPELDITLHSDSAILDEDESVIVEKEEQELMTEEVVEEDNIADEVQTKDDKDDNHGDDDDEDEEDEDDDDDDDDDNDNDNEEEEEEDNDNDVEDGDAEDKKEPSFSEESVPKTFSSISDENAPWNDLIDLEEKRMKVKKLDIRYKKLDLSDCESIRAQVTAIMYVNRIVIHPLLSDSAKLSTLIGEFAKLGLDLDQNAKKQPVIKKPYIGQPCCACYTVDDHWYRATVLAIEEREAKVKVHYVDYGNMEYQPIDKVHILKAEWAELPVMGITCKLWQIEGPGDVDPSKIYERLSTCLFQELPVTVRIKALNPELEVEIFHEDGTLAWQSMVDDGFITRAEEKSVL